MRVVIHDLPKSYHESLEKKGDKIIYADGKYAPCQGCFDCWTKSPAKCFMKDSLHDISTIIGRAEEIVIVTENLYGGYSPQIKNILD